MEELELKDTFFMKVKLNTETGWTLIDYDQDEFNFEAIVKKGLLKFIADNHGVVHDRLEDLHRSETVVENLESVRQEMFSIVRGDEFQACYKRYAKFLIDTYKDEHALIQKTPTVRIQPPRFMTTSFHSDSWYGHSQSTNSFWVPLTQVASNNTLNMAPSREISDETMKVLVNGNYSLAEINEMCIRVTTPTTAAKGQVLSFGPDMIHGAKMNTSEDTRVSFDFRIVDSDQVLGFKAIANYYRYKDLTTEFANEANGESSEVISQGFLSYSNYCAGVSPKSQLILCASVAKDKGLPIQRNESEIYVFENLPVLRHYLGSETPTFGGVIVFGTAIFNSQKQAEQILYLAKNNSKKILFAAEDILFTPQSDIQNIIDRVGFP